MSPRFTDGRTVPIRVARQLLEQRDRAIEELKRARGQLQQLRGGDDQLEKKLEAERQRADKAERQVENLRQKLDEFEEQLNLEASTDDDQSADGSDDGEQDRLEKRARSLAADLKRVRDRTDEQVEAARREERVRLLKGLGEVLDAVDRALSMDQPDGPWRRGLEAIRSRFVAFVRDQGAGLVGDVGESMNPDVHQAVATVEDSQFERGQVVRVDRPGIVLDDGTVVRPAQVVVAR